MVRQVISEETSAQVAKILENVVDGCITGTGLTGKNAYSGIPDRRQDRIVSDAGGG